MFKFINNFIFGKPSVESIIKPMARVQDQLQELIFDNAVEESENTELMRELSKRNLELATSTRQANRVADKFAKLLS